MYKTIILAIILLPLSFVAQAVDGMIDVASKHSVSQTADNLENVLKSKGMTIFARVPHSKAAKGVGVELPPMELVIFGNPKVGSPLMKCASTVAIDLPQKALVWEDKNGAVWISYNDPEYLKKRHNIQGCDAVLAKVSGALSKFTAAAAR
jgi:uncharacterized protein (DUF302 family)